MPNLILRSDHSVAETAGTEVMQRGDAVLDVEHIARWAGCVGNRQTVVPVADAKHDVFLSWPGRAPWPIANSTPGWQGWADPRGCAPSGDGASATAASHMPS